MSRSKKIDHESLQEANAKYLADLIADSATTPHIQVKIIKKLMEARENPDFFETMFAENMTVGECPECKHKNHWLIPEDSLNRMGWVSAEEDPRVKKNITAEDCSEFEEACYKRKSNY